MKVAVEKIVIMPGENMRTDFSGVDKLAEDIERHGLIQPIVVDQNNVLVAGECRYRAIKKLGHKKVEVFVRECRDTRERMVLSICENIKRRSLQPAEELRALAYLRKAEQESGNVTTKAHRGSPSKGAGRPNFAEKISNDTGMSARAINTKARIGERMSDGVARALNRREITQKQAEQLVKHPKAKQEKLVDKVKGKPLPVVKAIVAAAMPPEVDEARLLVEAKSLFETTKRNLQALTNNFRHIAMRELVFTSIDSRMSLLMVEGEFEAAWKKYKDLQYGTRRARMGQDDDRAEKEPALADERTIDVVVGEVPRRRR